MSQAEEQAYESDVPQFASVWYLPVLTVGSIIALTLLHAASGRHWIGTASALLSTGLRAGIVLFLLLLGFSLPLLPLIIIPALVFDATARWPRIIRAVLYALAVYTSYVSYLNFLLGGIHITLINVMVGLPLAAFVSWLVLAMVKAPTLQLRRLPATLFLVGCLFLLIPGQALAHDPGQCNEIGQMRLTSTLRGSMAIFLASVTSTLSCDQLEPRTLQARRSGETIAGPLRQVRSCQFQGAIQLPVRGRWFVYAELAYHGKPVETWLPVIAEGAGTHFGKLASLYELEAVSGSTVEVFSAAS